MKENTNGKKGVKKGGKTEEEEGEAKPRRLILGDVLAENGFGELSGNETREDEAEECEAPRTEGAAVSETKSNAGLKKMRQQENRRKGIAEGGRPRLKNTKNGDGSSPAILANLPPAMGGQK